jgi:hypothetical protein
MLLNEQIISLEELVDIEVSANIVVVFFFTAEKDRNLTYFKKCFKKREAELNAS